MGMAVARIRCVRSIAPGRLCRFDEQELWRLWWALAVSSEDRARRVRVALVVGTILMTINQGDQLLAGDITGVSFVRVLTHTVRF